MWTVIAGGICPPDKADELKARMAALLADPAYQTTMSSWRAGQPSDPERPLHLPEPIPA